MIRLLEWRRRPRVGRRSVGTAGGSERLTNVEAAAASCINPRINRKLGATRLAVLIASRGDSRRSGHAGGGRTKEAGQESRESTEQSSAAASRRRHPSLARNRRGESRATRLVEEERSLAERRSC